MSLKCLGFDAPLLKKLAPCRNILSPVLDPQKWGWPETLIIRSGKGDAYREVPLNAEVRETLRVWVKERAKRFSHTLDPAFFLKLNGERLSPRAIDLTIRQMGTNAHLELSAHVFRHTCLTNLVRRGNDLVLVAEIAGHKRLETTRRYSLPSAEDRQEAMEGLRMEC